MTHSDKNIPSLVVNRLTRAQYGILKSNNLIKDDELYVITDEMDGFSKAYLNGQTTDLSVYSMSDTEYESLVKTNAINASAIYVVNGETENMYGQRVTNVGTPISPLDAATKQYVDSVATNGIDLDDYYKKSETSSASQLSTALSAKADKATTLSGYGIADAKISGTAITLGSTTVSVLTAHQSLANYYSKTQVNTISSTLNNDLTNNLQTIVRRWIDQ